MLTPRPSLPTRSPDPGFAPPEKGRAVLALAVAVLALFAVVATLIGIGQRTRSLREEIIQTLEPARNQLYELQRLLALQEAEQRGGTPPAVLRPNLPDPSAARPERDVALSRLRTRSVRAGPEALEAFAELRADVLGWQEHLEQASGAPESVELRSLTQAEYAKVLADADRLHQVLNEEVAERRERLRALERWEAGLIVSMVLLALLAVLVMWRVSRQQAALVEQTRRLAAEAEQRRGELERVTEEKGQFIRGITHDLKNPLGAIDAYAQLLELGIKGSLSKEERRYVSRIRNASQQMLGTIQDLLELARAETSGIRIERRLVDLPDIVRDVVEDYRAAVESAGLSLETVLGDDLTPVVTDGRRVREVLGNLLSNAIKYTPRGGRVRIVADTRQRESDGGAFIVLQVQDTGPGIPAEEQERIFEEFQRLDQESAPGAGVGLSISRRMARLLGGDLTVESRQGEGATFMLWIPLHAALTPSEPLFED
jgi:signal transduction histidine kinase